MGQMINRRRVMGGYSDFAIKVTDKDGKVYVNRDTSITTLTSDDTSDFPNAWSFYVKLEVGKHVKTLSLYQSLLRKSANTITEVSLPEGLEEITRQGFDAMCSVETLVLPNTLTTLGGSALGENGFKHVTLPKSVNSVPATSDANRTIFHNCAALETINIEDGNPLFYGDGYNCLIWKSTNELYCGCKGTTVIPQGVTGIGLYSFTLSCPPYITIPSSVTYISAVNLTGLTWMKLLPTTPPGLHIANITAAHTYPIYVPDESVDIYKADSKFSQIADRIFPLSQFETDRITNNWD